MTATKAAAVYLRVSTDPDRPETSTPTWTASSKRAGYEAITYEEIESAAKHRPVLDRLLADACAGRVHAVAVWALDRLLRSMVGAIQTVLELDRPGVRVITPSAKAGSTPTAPFRRLLVATFGWVAE